MQVIWSRLDAVDEGERLRIEARLESLTRQAPLTRVMIEGSPPDADVARETVRITGKVDGMQVVAMRDELNLGEALEYALRAFEESIVRMGARWAAKEAEKKREAEKKLEAVAPPPAPAQRPVAAPAAAPAPAAASTRLRGPAPKVIELAPEQPGLSTRVREGVAGGLDGALGLLDGLGARLPRRSAGFRKASLAVSLLALVIALAAKRCGFDPDLAEVAVGPRGFSAEAGAPSATSRNGRPRGFSSAAEDSEDAPALPGFSAESEDTGFAQDRDSLDEQELDERGEPVQLEEQLEDPDDPLAEPPPPERPGILRRRR